MTRNEHDANLALVPLPRATWLEPSPLPRRRPSMLRRFLSLFGV
jgi:hypothetical protein